MRPRLIKPVTVLVRPVSEPPLDALGDAVVTPRRDDPIRVPAQVDWNQDSVSDGRPGRTSNATVTLLVDRARLNGWSPRPGDLITMPDGNPLFVTAVKPGILSPGTIEGDSASRSLLVELEDRRPEQAAASTYE